MAQERIAHTRSSVAGAVPNPADVKVGELIINFADRTLRTKNGANALIRMNQQIPVTDTEPVDPTQGDTFLTTAGQIRVFANLGAGLGWQDIAPPEDLTGVLLKSGGTMTGAINLAAGGTANQAIRKSEIETLIAAAVAPALLKAGGTMTGHITLPGGGAANQALQKSEIEDLITAAIPPDLSGVLLKTGGTMTGHITLPGGGTGNQAASANELAAAVAAHAAQPDPHTAYALSTELTSGLALKANLAGPTFTGVPAAPTAAPGNNTTQLATTAFVKAADDLKANLASPALTGNPTAPTPAPGDNDTSIATSAFVKAAIDAIPAPSAGITLIAPVFPVANAINFTGIPAGVKRITLMYDDLASNNTGTYSVRIGDSGGLETTGYEMRGVGAEGGVLVVKSSTANWYIGDGNTAVLFSGKMVLDLMDEATNQWAMTGMTFYGSANFVMSLVGKKSLSGVLDRLSVLLPATAAATSYASLSYE